jgi:pimeloyl-ACP methyl ester carboxylesterase
MHRSTVEIDGVAVHVDAAASPQPGERPPHAVVMIHGWPDTHRLWDATVNHLLAQPALRLRCVRFTLPGFDLSRPARPMSHRQLVDFFARVIDAVSPHEPVTLLLHDWGCVFGYEYLARHPHRVARVAAVDIGDYNSPAQWRSLELRQKLMLAGYQWWLALAWFIGHRLHGALGDRMTRAMARALRWRGDPSAIGWQMNYPYYVQWTGAYGGARDAAQVAPQCPVFFAWGRRKLFQFQTREWTQRIAAQAGSRAEGFDTGHWVMLQQPQAFHTALSDWLSGHLPLAAPTAAG